MNYKNTKNSGKPACRILLAVASMLFLYPPASFAQSNGLNSVAGTDLPLGAAGSQFLNIGSSGLIQFGTNASGTFTSYAQLGPNSPLIFNSAGNASINGLATYDARGRLIEEGDITLSSGGNIILSPVQTATANGSVMLNGTSSYIQGNLEIGTGSNWGTGAMPSDSGLFFAQGAELVGNSGGFSYWNNGRAYGAMPNCSGGAVTLTGNSSKKAATAPVGTTAACTASGSGAKVGVDLPFAVSSSGEGLFAGSILIGQDMGKAGTAPNYGANEAGLFFAKGGELVADDTGFAYWTTVSPIMDPFYVDNNGNATFGGTGGGGGVPSQQGSVHVATININTPAPAAGTDPCTDPSRIAGSPACSWGTIAATASGFLCVRTKHPGGYIFMHNSPTSGYAGTAFKSGDTCDFTL